MKTNTASAIAFLSFTFVVGCKSAKDDFHDNICEALSASGGDASKPTKDDLAKALTWSMDHVTKADMQKLVKMVSADGVAKTWIPELLRNGGKQYAGYEGACALADSFEKVYPCPPDDPQRCGKDVK